jgi:RNA polymerase sigma factor (sigma-70 family)
MRKKNYTDQEIIEGIKNQDNNVILFVYQKNFRSVCHYIEKNNGTKKDAEDVFQDAMITLYHKALDKNFKLKSAISTYLFSVVKGSWLNQLKHYQGRKVILNEADNLIFENDEFTEDILYAQRKKLFIKHFYELTEDCQKIIKYFLKGVSISEITKTMGYSSEQHTKNRRFRCKKNLIEKILLNPYFKDLTNGTIGENY